MTGDEPSISLREYMDGQVARMREDTEGMREDLHEVKSDVRQLREDVHSALGTLDSKLSRVVTWPALATAVSLAVGLCGLALVVAR